MILTKEELAAAIELLEDGIIPEPTERMQWILSRQGDRAWTRRLSSTLPKLDYEMVLARCRPVYRIKEICLYKNLLFDKQFMGYPLYVLEGPRRV